MKNVEGICQGGPEREKYPKTTRTGKATKKNKQKGSLEESCESLIVGTADGIIINTNTNTKSKYKNLSHHLNHEYKHYTIRLFTLEVSTLGFVSDTDEFT